MAQPLLTDKQIHKRNQCRNLKSLSPWDFVRHKVYLFLFFFIQGCVLTSKAFFRDDRLASAPSGIPVLRLRDEKKARVFNPTVKNGKWSETELCVISLENGVTSQTQPSRNQCWWKAELKKRKKERKCWNDDKTYAVFEIVSVSLILINCTLFKPAYCRALDIPHCSFWHGLENGLNSGE